MLLLIEKFVFHLTILFNLSIQIFSDGTTIYTFAQNNTVQKSLPNGINIYEFPNGQVERHYPDGRQEIYYTDRLVKFVHNTGEEELRFPDGTIRKYPVTNGRLAKYPNQFLQSSTIHPQGSSSNSTHGIAALKSDFSTLRRANPSGHVILRKSTL